jgi:hypothetical protein
MVLCNAIDFVLPLFTSLLINNAIKVVNSAFEAAQRAFHLRQQQQEQKKSGEEVDESRNYAKSQNEESW